MFFSPHTLQKKVSTMIERDEYGRPAAVLNDEKWETVGPCRCDDVSAERATGENGAVYPFRYKVVFPKNLGPITENTEVRCLDTAGAVRGKGVVKSPMQTNFLPYRVVFLE